MNKFRKFAIVVGSAGAAIGAALTGLVAHAQVTFDATSSAAAITEVSSGAQSMFWLYAGGLALLLIGLTVTVAVVRKVRGGIGGAIHRM